jgi:hypothetical protein
MERGGVTRPFLPFVGVKMMKWQSMTTEMEMRPKDYDAANRKGWVKVGWLYSTVVSPPTMTLVLGGVLALASASWPAWLMWYLVYGLLVSLLPVLISGVLLQLGYVGEMHMSNQKERRWPYLAAIVGAATAVFLLSWLNAPQLMRCLAMFSLVQATSLAVLNFFWLVSTHTTTGMSTAVIITLVFGWLPGLLIGIPLVVSLVVVRVYLKRHTLAQALGGCLVGLSAVLVLLPFGCFG